MGIIIAIILFSFIIIFHELGHFLLAKANGIRVDEFSLGLGPTLIGKEIGGTKFCIKLLPFGGACMMGEDDADDMSEGSFNSKSVWARISVIAAGPVFNLILAWIMSVIIILFVGYQPTTISGVSDGYSAQEQGMQAGDEIREINGRRVYIWNDISLYTLTHPGETTLEVVYERDGEEYTAVLEARQLDGDTSPKLGVISSGSVKPGILGTLEYGVYTVRYWVTYAIDSLRMLVTGQVGVRDMSGPVGIVSAVDGIYQAAAPQGMLMVALNLMNFGVLISANLGVMNLLPIPALDGGRLVFLIVEAIRRKRIPPEKEGMVHFAGFALLMVLMMVVMYNDILRLF
ncbi:RIP metalloprotease RseP [Mediterraneibacter glycyrrhizinilyticus]|uniref:RIP metalloprotease RseP n=1 Tax=Mediterraneibacter glycyrrhizinilyticus TaxID=342942 RepID=UPI0019606504|nr:RIP metalloprotease RseP [Mediterraneibacter glycyrrhizinilyticus]MBM6751978.1 RIP metalloprotease RseP [Mediterraneibacter glycyrrhizinilyticus]